jgi:inner membrane protein
MFLRTSVIARLVVMALILMGLLIPLTMVQSIVSERTARRDSVISDVSATWGGPQTIVGPLLVVPYQCAIIDQDGKARPVIGRATFLPETLNVRGALAPQVRGRNLFAAVVYSAHLTVTGRFSPPDLASVTRGPVQPLWNETIVSVGVSDPRGVAKRVTLNWAGTDQSFEPGVVDSGVLTSGLQTRVDLSALAGSKTPIPFSLTLDLNGSRDLRVVPAGNDTAVSLASPWPHPSFIGAPLPQSRSVDGSGFNAEWEVPYFGRGFSRAWIDAGIDREKMRNQAAASAFGVSLVQPVDIYQQAERAVKYAAMFIVLTFVVFFLFEIVRARMLHPVQYVFVGFALCVFYLLLVSLSEHIGFDVAYAAAAVATTTLISLYSVFALGGRLDGALVGTSIAVVYGFLYLLLRLEDYALLAGSVGLFATLSVVMLLTRKVNWYDLHIATADHKVTR